MKGHLDLELTKSAMDAIRRFMDQAPTGHVLSLVQMGLPGDARCECVIGTYSIEKINAAEKEFERAGHALWYMIGGIEFVVEPHFAKLLKGKCFDFHEGRFCIRERENGI